MHFVPINLNIRTWHDLLPYYENLTERPINSMKDLEIWIKNRSILGAVIDEDLAWRYIKMTCHTDDKNFNGFYEYFMTKISPEVSKAENKLDIKLYKSDFFDKLPAKYDILKRSVKNSIELFRKENLDLFAELGALEQKFGQISGAMTVEFDGKKQTLQQASNYLKELDRDLRKEVYFLIRESRFESVNELNDLLTKLIEKRHKVALNAGFENYRDYKHIENERFDYSVQDVLDFDESIKTQVVPIENKIIKRRKEKLGYADLKPWDLAVDVSMKPPLVAFNSIDELIKKSIKVFSKVRPKYGDFLLTMKQNGYLDLDSRIGKAPGGYNYPLLVSNVPFIFMNATNNVNDLSTLMHEGGHAIHAFMAKDLELSEYKETPAEIAELASMSMELISMEYWDIFFEDKDELKRAKIQQLESVISVLPWVATIDKFQQWLYTNPTHTIEQRNQMWYKITSEYSSPLIDQSEIQKYIYTTWQKQMHIFEVPFYYIEYAIAQLGAIAIWRNYKQNPEKALDQYEAALSLGYSKTLPELYKTAGIKFDFGADYIGQLMEFVYNELEKFYEE